MKYLARIGIVLAAALLVSAIAFGLVSMGNASVAGSAGTPRGIPPSAQTAPQGGTAPQRGSPPQGRPGDRGPGNRGFSLFGIADVLITLAEIAAIATIGVVVIRAMEKGRPATDVTLVPGRAPAGE